jgi:hypothetical protein
MIYDDELGLHPSSGARYRRGKEAKGGSWLGCLAGGGADDAASAQYGATRSDPTDYQPLSDGQDEASAVSSAGLQRSSSSYNGGGGGGGGGGSGGGGGGGEGSSSSSSSSSSEGYCRYSLLVVRPLVITLKSRLRIWCADGY